MELSPVENIQFLNMFFDLVQKWYSCEKGPTAGFRGRKCPTPGFHGRKNQDYQHKIMLPWNLET